MYALVSNGTVVHLAAATFSVHADLSWALIPTGASVGVGYAAAESNGAWTFTAPSAPTPTPAQEAAAALAGTVALTSTATSSLDGTYAIDPEKRSDMESEILNYVTNGSFIGGSATIDWPDTSGTMHTFDATQMKAFVTEIGVYVKTLKGIKAANALPSGMTSFPSNAITIA